MECHKCGTGVREFDVKCEECGVTLENTSATRLIGETVLGQYKITGVLGQGGMSIVFRGVHTLTEQEVALKILPPELAAHSEVKSRFLEEAKALAQLDHPHIVHLYNFGQAGGSFVLAMQLVRGCTFEQLIWDNERLPWQDVARLGAQTASALDFAHQRGIIHRDMKPSNVLIREDDGAATVMDFGIAKIQKSTRLTATGQTMGTVRYMSPEQVKGLPVDARTDVYSLGATLYEALVGETPFDGDNHFEIMTRHLTEVPVPPSQRGVELPVKLEAAIMTSLAKEPGDRQGTAEIFRAELQAVLDAPPEMAAIAFGTTAAHDVAVGAAAVVPAAETSETIAAAAATALPAAPSKNKGRKVAALAVACVAVAGVGVAAKRLSRQGNTSVDSAVAMAHPSPDPFPPMFLPGGWEPRATWSDDARWLRISVLTGRAPKDVILLVEGARNEFFRAAKEAGNTVDASAPPPLSVVVTEPEAICDRRIYEDGKVFDRCGTERHWYRPIEKTLFIADDASIAKTIATGVSLSMCNELHKQVEGCLGLVETVENSMGQKASPSRGRAKGLRRE